jgi:hypothetical protein
MSYRLPDSAPLQRGPPPADGLGIGLHHIPRGLAQIQQQWDRSVFAAREGKAPSRRPMRDVAERGQVKANSAACPPPGVEVLFQERDSPWFEVLAPNAGVLARVLAVAPV